MPFSVASTVVQLLTYAQKALSVSQAALPAVGRYLLAGGPEIALVCHQVAVYPGPITTLRLGDNCVFHTRPQVIVAYSKDCYPRIKTEGGTAQIPDPAEVSSWTADYLTDIAALYDALMDAALGDEFGDPAGQCTGVDVGVANYSGPRGGVCTVRIPLTILTA
jgi:hypothetical protein